jgi:hypothetical protein
VTPSATPKATPKAAHGVTDAREHCVSGVLVCERGIAQDLVDLG